MLTTWIERTGSDRGLAGKDKKKKGAEGRRKPTYAKGKKVTPSSQKKKRVTPATKPVKKERPGGRETRGQAKEGSRVPAKSGEQSAAGFASFNLIRKGTLEMKVFLALMVLVVIGAASLFPSSLERLDYERKEDESSGSHVSAQEIKPSAGMGAVLAQEETDGREEGAGDKKEEGKKEEGGKEGDEKGEKKEEEPSGLAVFLFGMVQYLLFWAIFTFLGLNMSRKAGLTTPILDQWARGESILPDLKKALIVTLPAGVVTAGVVFGSHSIFNALGNIKEEGFKPSLWSQLIASLASGTVDEVLLRLFIMSALVCLLMRWGKKGIYAAIIIASFLIGIPKFFYKDVEKIVALRDIVSISIIGLVAGYLYYKRGFEHSMLYNTISAASFSVLLFFL